ncbi:hypothetical protein G6F59_018570 [Rhizopus arrhizus]|nr:hypothetical protein G6F59_018570 [Rhizopus arrhizus]
MAADPLDAPRTLAAELAVGRPPDPHPGPRRADGIVAHVAVGLHANEHGRFGRTVQLLQVDADGAVEDEQVGADGLARGISTLPSA